MPHLLRDFSEEELLLGRISASVNAVYEINIRIWPFNLHPIVLADAEQAPDMMNFLKIPSLLEQGGLEGLFNRLLRGITDASVKVPFQIGTFACLKSSFARSIHSFNVLFM